MALVNGLIEAINEVVWGPPMLVMILGTGLFLSVGLKFMPVLKLRTGFKLLFARSRESFKGDITPFKALMTSLSATIGTGNIAGVATAIVLGGPGALFWMWCTAMVGMATKFAETVLAVHFRERDDRDCYVGGPMYYIKNGLSPRCAWLGVMFAFFGVIAGFGIGNTVQANSIALVLQSNFHIPSWLTGMVLMVLIGAVLLGGVRRISTVAGKLVPLMTFFYLLAGITVLILFADQLPSAFLLIIHKAFTPAAAEGGFAGATVWMAIHFGVARGVFSNEAGLGSAPIAHAAAKTDCPVKQGTIAMLGTFIDTIIVCSITGLAIVASGVWSSGVNGAELTASAFANALPMGNYLVAIALTLFAFTTILGWSFYCERCLQYLFGERIINLFRWLWIAMVPLGAMSSLNLVWLLADTFNAMMAIPNLIALVLLSPVVFRLTRQYFAIADQTAEYKIKGSKKSL